MKIRNISLVTSSGNSNGSVATFFDISYKYSINKDEFLSLEKNENVIFERVSIFGFIGKANPAENENEDLDLNFKAEPVFVARSNSFAYDSTEEIYIRAAKRNLFEDTARLKNTLKVLTLNSVRCYLELSIGQYGYSNKETIISP